MNRHPIMAELLADDLLLERVGTGTDPGPDPVGPLLAALARHAELPLRAAAGPRRLGKRRALTALTALVVGVSGVGVAAAVTGPDFSWPRQARLVPDPGISQKATPAAPPEGLGKGAQGPPVATGGGVQATDGTRRVAVAPPRVVVSVATPTAPPAAPAASAAAGAVAKGAPEQLGREDRDQPIRATPIGDAATPKPEEAASLDTGIEPKRQGQETGSYSVSALTGLSPAPIDESAYRPTRAHRGVARPTPERPDVVAHGWPPTAPWVR